MSEPTPTPDAPKDPWAPPVPGGPIAGDAPLGLVQVGADAFAGEPVLVRKAPEYGLVTRLATELFGTFALVIIVLGTAMYANLTQLDVLALAVVGGLALAGLYAAFAHVSGAHLNPAVTIASAIAGRVSALDAVGYVLAQVAGGAAAAGLLRVTIPKGLGEALQLTSDAAIGGLAANGFEKGSWLATISSGQFEFGIVAALVVELVGAAVLAAVVLATKPGVRSALAVGAAYAAGLVLAGPVTGGGLNPARSTAAALLAIGGSDHAAGQLWLFWAAPLVGAALAGLTKLALGKRELDTWVMAELEEPTVEELEVETAPEAR